jgi:hypothetical protein
MKKTFLLMVASVLLVVSGFAQTPADGNNTDQASIKGCLGGPAGNYTVAEDGTSQILKITISTITRPVRPRVPAPLITVLSSPD